MFDASRRRGGYPIRTAWTRLILEQSVVGGATFKKKLDGFLSSIADEPQSPGYTARRRAVSNSLTHMIPACTQ